MKWVLRKKMAIEYTCQGEPVVNWYPLQGELVTLLDASCFCQDRSKACHWSVVSFQATPFLGNGMDFMYTCEFWSSGLTNYGVLAETSDFHLNPKCTNLLIVQVSQKVQEALTERAASFGLILDDISLVRIYWLCCLRIPLCNFCAFRAC